jgi:hypothetical protein
MCLPGRCDDVTFGSVTTLRNPVTRRVGVLGIAFFLFMMAVGRDGATVTIFGAGVLLLIVFALRPRVSLAADAVTVVNIRRHEVQWADVDDVMMRLRWGYPSLTFKVGTGRLTAWAVCVGRAGGESWCREATRQVQTTWSHATGRPMPVAVSELDLEENDFLDTDDDSSE